MCVERELFALSRPRVFDEQRDRRDALLSSFEARGLACRDEDLALAELHVRDLELAPIELVAVQREGQALEQLGVGDAFVDHQRLLHPSVQRLVHDLQRAVLGGHVFARRGHVASHIELDVRGLIQILSGVCGHRVRGLRLWRWRIDARGGGDRHDHCERRSVGKLHRHLLILHGVSGGEHGSTGKGVYRILTNNIRAGCLSSESLTDPTASCARRPLRACICSARSARSRR